MNSDKYSLVSESDLLNVFFSSPMGDSRKETQGTFSFPLIQGCITHHNLTIHPPYIGEAA